MAQLATLGAIFVASIGQLLHPEEEQTQCGRGFLCSATQAIIKPLHFNLHQFNFICSAKVQDK